jgi:hypothetical protein
MAVSIQATMQEICRQIFGDTQLENVKLRTANHTSLLEGALDGRFGTLSDSFTFSQLNEVSERASSKERGEQLFFSQIENFESIICFIRRREVIESPAVKAYREALFCVFFHMAANRNWNIT